MNQVDKEKKKLLFIASFEDASILRKFSILFLIASIVPLAILYYIYFQQKTVGYLNLTDTSYTIIMVLIAIGVCIGFVSMRSLIAKVVDITKANRKALENFLSRETLQELNKGENEIVVLSRSFSAVTKQLEDNIRSLELAKKTLQSVMFKVGQGISNMQRIDTFLELIVETLTSALNSKVTTLLLSDEANTQLTINTVFGADFDKKKPVHIQLSQDSPFLKVIENKRPMVVPPIIFKNPRPLELNKLFGESLLCVPLVFKDKVSGILTLSRPEKQNGTFSQDDITLTFNLATQTAVALENSKLNTDIEKTYFETVSALALAVDAKDRYSRGHLDRVAEYVNLIARHLNLTEEDLHTLKGAARLHDLGKIGIPDDILKKEGSLTGEEWVIMRRHPEIGESIIKPVRSLHPLCDLIRHHHEKIDGTGYPDKLKGNEISLLVRILTVCDVFDALTTERPYRPKKSDQEAAQIMRSMDGHLDQKIVEILLKELKIS